MPRRSDHTTKSQIPLEQRLPAKKFEPPRTPLVAPLAPLTPLLTPPLAPLLAPPLRTALGLLLRFPGPNARVDAGLAAERVARDAAEVQQLRPSDHPTGHPQGDALPVSRAHIARLHSRCHRLDALALQAASDLSGSTAPTGTSRIGSQVARAQCIPCGSLKVCASCHNHMKQ